MSQTFKYDQRTINPGLHLLYTRWAVEHLLLIEKAKKLLSISNINLIDIQDAMDREKNKLIAENAAYAEAQDILEIVKRITKEETKDHD